MNSVTKRLESAKKKRTKIRRAVTFEKKFLRNSHGALIIIVTLFIVCSVGRLYNMTIFPNVSLILLVIGQSENLGKLDTTGQTQSLFFSYDLRMAF